MGIRLVMEAQEHAPESLTWRELHALQVLASSAMDSTRGCPPGIESRPDIITRLRLGRAERYAVLAALCAKGALVKTERGRNGVRAAYSIAEFPGTERPGDPDARAVDNSQGADPAPVDNPAKRPGNPDATHSVKGPGTGTEGSGKPGLKHPESPDPSAGRTSYRGVRGFKTGGGTPLTPQASAQRARLFAVPSETEGEGEISAENPDGQQDGRETLIAEILVLRPEWSRRSIARVLERPDVAARPWRLVARALRLVAEDPETQSPGRLAADGPWWSRAARTSEAKTPATHPYEHDPETGACRTCRAPEVDRCHRRRRTA